MNYSFKSRGNKSNSYQDNRSSSLLSCIDTLQRALKNKYEDQRKVFVRFQRGLISYSGIAKEPV
jgi:hypothetical protein